MATTVGETYFCPFPRSFYGPESPCSQTDETITGAPQQPWVQPGGNFDGVKVVFYVGLALVVFWLSVRAMEAYAEIKQVVHSNRGMSLTGAVLSTVRPRCSIG